MELTIRVRDLVGQVDLVKLPTGHVLTLNVEDGRLNIGGKKLTEPCT